MQGFVDFWVGQGPEGFIRIFWFYFFLELPRYVLLDYVYLSIYRIKQGFNKEQYKEARQALWAEQPRVTSLIPGKNEGKNDYRLSGSLEGQTHQHFQLRIVDEGADDDSHPREE